MTLTIRKGVTPDHFILTSKDRRFTKEFGAVYKVYNYRVYDTLAEITAWVNNELEEECLFEVD